MKAILLAISALPLDRMTLQMLPPGELDVQIHLRCDREAYAKLLAFFRDASYAQAERFMPRTLPAKPVDPVVSAVKPTRKLKRGSK